MCLCECVLLFYFFFVRFLLFVSCPRVLFLRSLFECCQFLFMCFALHLVRDRFVVSGPSTACRGHFHFRRLRPDPIPTPSRPYHDPLRPYPDPPPTTADSVMLLDVPCICTRAFLSAFMLGLHPAWQHECLAHLSDPNAVFFPPCGPEVVGRWTCGCSWKLSWKLSWRCRGGVADMSSCVRGVAGSLMV